MWLYPGKAAWHFVSLPTELAQEIDENFGYLKQNRGSIAVTSTIKNVTWDTSIFCDKKSDSYLLRLKSQIRKQAQISVGNEVDVTIEIKYSFA